MAEMQPQLNLAAENEVLRQHQRVLIDLARYASGTSDFQTFLDDMVVRVSAALEIDHVKLLRYRPMQGDLILEAGVGWHPEVVKAVAFPTDFASPPGKAFQTGQPVMVPDLLNCEEFRVSAVLRDHGIVSLLNVPVFQGEAVWGVLEADSTILRGFGEDTALFMTAAASLVGLVLARVDAERAQVNALDALAEEVRHGELLLREMHHRVKNNFQTILAMVSLQMPKLPADQGRAIVAKFTDAILAMSLAHDQLSMNQKRRVVGLAGYLTALAANIQRSVENVSIEVTADALEVSIDQAVPIGLIVNEAVTNSIKHAFGAEGGAVRIALETASRPGIAALTISDNGQGAADGDGGSGLKLMRALADQIGGRLDRQNSDQGTAIRLTFPIRPHRSE